MPAIEAKSPAKRVETSTIKNKTLVNADKMGEVHKSETFEND